MKSILDGVTMGTMKRAVAHDLAVAQADEETCKLVQETATLAQAACIHLHVTDWVTAQQEGSNTQDCNLMDLWPESTGPKTPAERWHKYWRG